MAVECVVDDTPPSVWCGVGMECLVDGTPAFW